jgi:hypothetical protein
MGDGSAAGWQRDPAGRHELRYHDGVAFTSYVSDRGVVSHDVEGAVSAPVSMESVLAGAAAVQPPSQPQPQPPFGLGAPPPFPGASWPGPTMTPQRKTGRAGLTVAIVIAALEALAIVILSVALVGDHTTTKAPQPIGSTVSPSGSFTPTMGTLVYSSFFKSTDNWPTGTLNPNTSATLSNGEYVVTGSTEIHHLLLTPYELEHPGLSVYAVATGFSSGDLGMGVGCQSGSGVDPALIYQLVAYPNGEWYIEEGRLGGAVSVLDQGFAPDLGTAASLELTCVITKATGSERETQLVGYISGSKVGAIGDTVKGTSLSGYIPLLLLASHGATVHAAFKTMYVRSVDPQTVSRSSHRVN